MRKLPFFQSGLFSIFNVNRKNLWYDYMKGTNIDNIKNDWKTVGDDIRKSMLDFCKI